MSDDTVFEAPVVLYRDPGEDRVLGMGGTGHMKFSPEGLSWKPGRLSRHQFPAFTLQWRDIPEGGLWPSMGRAFAPNGTMVGLKGQGFAWVFFVDIMHEQAVMTELKKHFEIGDG